MFNLLDKNVSYILISPERKDNTVQENSVNCSKLCNILYAKSYTIIPVTGLYNGIYEKSFIAISPEDDNNQVRSDTIFLMDQFGQECAIVKYKGEDSATMIKEDGSEKPLKLSMYDQESQNKTYLYNGLAFSFTEKKRYVFPKRKEDLKDGMIVEFFNNNKWSTRKILDLEKEYDKMYKLLIKYEKIRIECL